MLFKKLFVKEFMVEHIHCDKCKAKVEQSLKAIDGVKKASADVASGSTVIKSTKPIDNKLIEEALEENGFKAIFDEEL